MTHIAVVAVAAAALSCAAAGQTTWYVDDDNCPGPGSGTEADPFCSIQDGIHAAADGDEVLVHPGTYEELIRLDGAAVILRSLAGPSSTTIKRDRVTWSGSTIRRACW